MNLGRMTRGAVLLRGTDGSELELSIVGYQFPDDSVDPWDSNSLLVSIRVAAPRGTWEVVDPCLTTWEGAGLVRWLATSAAMSAAGLPRSTLTLPNLTVSAEAAGGHGGIRVVARFELERRPPWEGTVVGAGDLVVELEVSRRQLAQAAASLADDLACYPQRGDDPTL